MNTFQKSCIDACKRTLESLHYHSVEFREITGRSENYFMASVLSRKGTCQLYVYEDEAGFGFNNNKEWRICEKPAYPNPQELIATFCTALRNALANSEIQGTHTERTGPC